MGSDDSRSRSKIGLSGMPPRRWPSPLLTEELSLETLQDTTYVRLMHPEHGVAISLCDAEGFEVSPKGTRSEKAWSWLKRKPEPVPVPVVMAKSKSHNAWPWPGKPPGDEFQFDPSKRWPQGW